jgi:hypothetical protein
MKVTVSARKERRRQRARLIQKARQGMKVPRMLLYHEIDVALRRQEEPKK